MKGTALLLLCAATVAQATQPQLTLSGKVSKCNSGEAAKLCTQNGWNGYLIVHENCNQFYKCAHGTAIPYFCPANLLYNPSAKICDWPQNVQCGDRPIVAPGAESEDCSEDNNDNEDGGEDNSGGSDGGNDGSTCNCNPEEAPAICAAEGSNGVLVAHQNCNQFYKCDHGVAAVLNCPSGLLYNPYTEQCDWAHNVDCGDRPIVDIESGGNDGGDEDCEDSGNGGSGSGDGNDGDNSGICNCNPDEAPSICAADGSDGALIAHQNCNQFYKCDHGVPVVLNCPPNLLYNPFTEQCEWPYNVDCGDRPIVEIDSGNNGGDEECEETGNGNNSSNENNGDSCNCNPEEAPGICAADGSDGTLIAHENCNQFYKCSHGIPVPLFCQSNLVYNPYTERCDWPENVDCGDRPIVEVDGGDSGSGGSGDSGSGGSGDGDNGGDGTCNCNPGEAPGICAADDSDGTLIAHENCNQFYKCAHGVPVPLFCPVGLVYNPYIERCDWQDNVDCGDKPIVEIDCEDNGSGGNGDNGSGDNGDSGSGGNGDNGNGDNGEDGTCNCNPGEAPSICSAVGSDGTLIAHENCNQYYKCNHGVPVPMFCPAGLVYNPYIECCDWPDNVDCGDKPIVEIDGGDSGSGGSGDNGSGGNGDNGSGGSGDSGNGGNGGDGTCNCNPGEAPGICAADGSDGILIAHENCNQFYKCAHGVPVAMFCQVGLVYNPYKERCDWPENEDCGDRPIVEVDGGDSGSGGSGDSGSGDNGDSGNGDNGNGDNSGNGTCNCNPGEAPGICAADGSDGTLIAHENCNQFYKCAHGVPVPMFCQAGLVYNPYTERCDWPENVDCGDRPIVEVDGGDSGSGGSGDSGSGGNGDSGSGDNGNGDNGGDGTCNCNPGEAPGICAVDGSDGTLIAHENCNQFYKCANGIPVALFCNANLLYNPYAERCDWPENVDCGDRPIVEVDGGDSGSGGSGDSGSGGNGDSGSGDNGNGDNGGDGTCNCNPGEAPGICAVDGSDGTLIAHENCNQFYKCANGIPVALFCNANLLYNPYTERCDWPENVDCGDRPIVEVDGGDSGSGGSGDSGSGGNGDSGSGDNGNGDNGGDGTCNCNPGEAPGICAVDGSDGTLIAHENCNQFYKCANGIPVALFCNANLLYNPYTERCDWPENVDCGDRPIVEIDDGDNGSGGNGDNGSGGSGDNGNGDNGGDGTCNCNPGEAPGICAADGSDGILIAHENCNQFYKCAYGVPVPMFCQSGLVYNPYTKRCDWPENVDCGDRPIVEADGGDSGSGGSGDSGNGDNGNGDNGGDGTCNCNPGEAPGICAADGSDGTLIAHENCNQFYKCANGIPVALFCNLNLLYNPYIERCDWPENVDCGDRPIVEIDDGDNGSGGNGDNGSGGSEDNGNGDNGGDGTCNCNPGEAPGICAADGSDGILVAHENCNQFYKCAYGVPVPMFCQAGLVYNPYTERCDWPENVDCGDRPIVEVDGGDSGSGGSGDSGSEGNGDSGSGGSGDGDNGGDGTCNCNPGEAPGICAADGSDGTLIAHENCNQFYKCANGIPVALFCNANLLYNPYTERCDWPENIDCGDRPIVEIDDGDNGSGGNGDNGSGGSGDNGNGDNSGNGTCNCNPGEAPGICAADESDGILIAHENCNQFYKCANGLPVSLFCNDNLLYNPYTERCDWPENVDCGDRPIVEVDSGDNVSPSTTVENNNDEEDCTEKNGNGSTCNCNPGDAAAICASAGSSGTLIAHENCNQFYMCAHGLPVPRFCSNGLMYNPHIERCDWSFNVDCGDRPIAEIEDGDNSNEDNNENDSEDEEDNESTCNCNPDEAPAICAEAGSGGTTIAHANCNQFYLCDHGVPVPQFCARGLVYNPYRGRCDWPANVECGDRPIVEVEGDNNNGNESGSNGQHGDPSQAPEICAAPDSDGVLVAHENCNQFYVCNFGKPLTLDCPSNLLYNPSIEDCDWPHNVVCGDRIIPDGGGNDGPCACYAREAPAICASTGSNGKLIAHENCDQYYVCLAGAPVARSCPRSLFYDPHTEQCLWPASVNCEGRVVSSYASLNKHSQARREFL